MAANVIDKRAHGCGLLGDRMGRDRITERIAKGEVAAERAVLGRKDNRCPTLNKMIMQGVGIITSEPNGDALAESFLVAKVRKRRANGERDWLRVEHHRTRRSVRKRLQSENFGIESARRFDVFSLDADKVGADQVGHAGCLFSRFELISVH